MRQKKWYGDDEFSMNTGVWYRMNGEGFAYVSDFIRRHCVREADMTYFNKSVEVIQFKFEHSQKLYIKISDEPSLHFLYRSDYNPRYMYEPWMDLNDAILTQSKDRCYKILNGAKTGKRTVITNFDSVNYELTLGTWYEVNEKEYDYIICGLPYDISKDLWIDEITYGYQAAAHRPQIYIMFDYNRNIDNECYSLSVSKTAPREYAKPIKLTTAMEQQRKAAEKMMKNSVYGAFPDINCKLVYGASRFPELRDNFDDKMWFADWDKESNKEDKKEKIMENNKLNYAINIIDRHYDKVYTEYKQIKENDTDKVLKSDPLYKELLKLDEELAKRCEDTHSIKICKLADYHVPTKAMNKKLEDIDKTYQDKIKVLGKKCAEAKDLCALTDSYQEITTILLNYNCIENAASVLPSLNINKEGK